MKPLFITLVLAVALTSCTNYGKKVKSGDIEVYYKDGITEDQAQKTADAFDQALKASNPDAKGRKSFQLTKATDTILLKMVIDKSKLDQIDDESFYSIQAMVSEDVFKGSPVNLMLTDDSFKGIKTFSYRKPTVPTPVEDNAAPGDAAPQQ